MSRVPLVDPSTTDGQRRASLDRIGAAFGTVPAMFRAVANSPAALQSMWAAFGAFSTGALGAALSEQIAVAVADRNKCRYCLAAHTALGLKAGVSEQQLRAAQGTEADDPRVRALLEFAVAGGFDKLNRPWQRVPTSSTSGGMGSRQARPTET